MSTRLSYSTIFLATLAALVVVSPAARAQDVPPETSQSTPPSTPDDASTLLREAEDLERALEFAEALWVYERAASAGAATRAGRHARERAAQLRAFRDEDAGFASYAALEAMRRGAITEARLEEFASRVELMNAGRVRDESLFLLGESFFRRLDDPRRAIDFYEQLVSSTTAPRGRRRIAAVALAEARARTGEADQALAGLEAEQVDAAYEARALRSELLRQRAREGALAGLALALLVLFGLGRPVRTLAATLAGLRAGHVLAFLYVACVPAFIAELYEPTMSEAFLLHGAAAAPLLILARSAGVSLTRRRASRGVFAAVATSLVLALAAVAWLALDATDGLVGLGFGVV